MLIDVLFQFIAYMIFQSLLQLPFDWLYLKPRKDNLDRPESMKEFTFFICMLLGLAMGAITLIIVRSPFIGNSWLRFMNLFITPYIVGKTIHYIHHRRTFEPDRVYLFDHFWNAYIFAFSTALLRFVFVWN